MLFIILSATCISTKSYVLRGLVGDTAPNLQLRLYTDADFAGDRLVLMSTSGGLLTLCGETTCFPLGATCARQTAVAHNALEAEIRCQKDRAAGIRSLGKAEEECC